MASLSILFSLVFLALLQTSIQRGVTDMLPGLLCPGKKIDINEKTSSSLKFKEKLCSNESHITKEEFFSIMGKMHDCISKASDNFKVPNKMQLVEASIQIECLEKEDFEEIRKEMCKDQNFEMDLGKVAQMKNCVKNDDQRILDERERYKKALEQARAKNETDSEEAMMKFTCDLLQCTTDVMADSLKSDSSKPLLVYSSFIIAMLISIAI